MRKIAIETNFLRAPSCLISCGGTRVLCAATVTEGVPPFLKGKGQGWLTAEYAMLPGSTDRRKQREYGKRDGRSVEIQRLIGRSLRAAFDLEKLGERTITIDCDVIQADGGTRTASITGAFAALTLACDKLMKRGLIVDSPVVRQVAAVSVGIVEDELLCDLCYKEDSAAMMDMNVVMNENGEFIELQATAEGRCATKAEMNSLVEMAQDAIFEIIKEQKMALGVSE